MGPALILGGVIVLLAMAITSSKAKASEQPKGLPPVPDIHPDMKSTEVREHAESHPDPAIKEDLHTKADILREAERREIRIPPKVETPSFLPSGVKEERWKEYVKRSVRGTVGMKSASGALGLYQMGARALASIGWVTLDPSGQWIAAWKKNPTTMSTGEFLADPNLQYQAFVEYTWNDYSALHDASSHPLDYAKNHVVLAGQHATLSGLLGLTYYAGVVNALRWLQDPVFRDKSPKLTDQYKRFNGLF